MIPPQPIQGNDLKLDGLTRQEIKKIEKSMKRPQFMGLLNQYMIEISDPKNKAQYDEYLKQMQKEGELPKHMKLVKLKPQFCLRTFIVSNRNKTHEMKFFLNMCSSDYIEKPNCEAGKDQNGGVGYNWRVPNSIGKIRYDQDKQKKPCQVVDVAFHPDTFHFASHPSFQAMIISIALEGVQKQLGQRKQTLSRDYVILKNLKCKGQNNQPALLPIRYIEGKAYNRGEGPAEQQRNTEGKQTKLQKQINKQKQQHDKQKKDKQKQAKQESKQLQIQDEDLNDVENNKKLVQDLQKGIQAPKYTSIYTYKTDYSQFIDDSTIRNSRKLPNAFTVQFKVPRMENISQAVKLDINEKKIVLQVQDKYFIDVSFDDMKIKSYPLKHAQAKAKFDKKKKTLRVQIPVDIASIPQQQTQQTKQQKQEIVNNQHPQNDKIIEDETWKNKVLQIPQQTQANKFLAQAQAQQQSKPNKKLIQQIDEDDYIEQNKQQKKVQEIGQQIVEKEQQTLESRRFSVKKYYHNINKQSNTDNAYRLPSQKLNYVIKQTHKFVTVMIYMRNYSQQQVKAVLRQDSCQFILLWLNNGQPSVTHLCLIKDRLANVKKIQVLKRVGYYALVIYKDKVGQLWEQLCIQNKFENKTGQQYKTIINQIQSYNEQLNRKKEQLKNKLAEQEQNKKNDEKQKINVNQQRIQNKTNSIEHIDDNIIDSKTKSKMQTKQVDQNCIFQKLPIQFLKFNAPFVETLN